MVDSEAFEGMERICANPVNKPIQHPYVKMDIHGFWGH
jgi:hypothetical protein